MKTDNLSCRKIIKLFYHISYVRRQELKINRAKNSGQVHNFQYRLLNYYFCTSLCSLMWTKHSCQVWVLGQSRNNEVLRPNRECRLRIWTGKKCEGLMQSSPAARKRNRQEGKVPAAIMSKEATQTYCQDGGQSFISVLKSDFSWNFRKAKLKILFTGLNREYKKHRSYLEKKRTMWGCGCPIGNF